MPAVLASQTNLLINVLVYEEHVTDQGSYRQLIDEGHYEVDRNCVIRHSKIFAAMLRDHTFKEGFKDEITIEAGSVFSISAWVRAVHGYKPSTNVDLREVWLTLIACHKYDSPVSLLEEWFAAWYSQRSQRWIIKAEPGLENRDPACLLYPCYTFNHAAGFMEVTQFLVYFCHGYINESKPVVDTHLHLPQRVIQQLNAARGRLKTILFNPIYAPMQQILDNGRTCCDRTAADYQRALMNTNSWPLEKMGARQSMGSILDGLRGFNYPFPYWPCWSCSQNYQKIVRTAVMNAENYFSGLCLDCMDISNPKTSSSDKDYWRHEEIGEYEWMQRCRIEHSQPTWYFSFMGRREVQEKFRREKAARREEHKMMIHQHRYPNDQANYNMDSAYHLADYEMRDIA